jgi:hypothetical protein
MPWRGPDYAGEFPSLGWAIADWIEYFCVISDGDHIGEPFKLTQEMVTFLVHHYRLKPTANERSPRTAWVNRRSQLVRPQKWGKGPFSAAITCAEATGPVVFAGWDAAGEPVGREWPTPHIQITAVSEDQTDNVWRVLQPMIELGPLADDIPDTGLDRINLPSGGVIEPVTASAQSRLGQRITFVVQDETHSWNERNRMVRLADTQKRNLSGTGGRLIETTNAYDPSENSVAQLTAETPRPDVHVDHVLAPANLSIHNKRERRKVLKKVYGDSWWVDLDRIDAEIEELVLRDPAQAERFYLNRIVTGERQWIAPEVWLPLAQPGQLADGEEIALGFDGSINDDWSALVASRISDGWITPLEVWRPPPGAAPGTWQVDTRGVRAAVRDAFSRYRVALLYADPHEYRSEIGDWAEEHGEGDLARVREFDTHSAGKIGPAVDQFKADAMTGRLPHDGDELLNLCVANARTAKRGRYTVIEKEAPRSPKKIDVAMSAVIAYQARNDAIELGLAGTQEYGVYSSSNW